MPRPRKEGYPPPPPKGTPAKDVARHYRDVKRGGPFVPIPCGTMTYDDDGTLKGSWAPFERHKKAGENPRDCELCYPILRELNAIQQRKHREKKKAAKAAE